MSELCNEAFFAFLLVFLVILAIIMHILNPLLSSSVHESRDRHGDAEDVKIMFLLATTMT